MARYTVISELGQGGMGVVYKALHLELNREVAMKVMLTPAAPGSVAYQRFEREIEALGRLEHPGIVRIFDKGLSDGKPFFTMELVRGLTLHHLITNEGPLAPGRIIEILSQIVTALDHCHRQGFLHRDVKPRNLMVGDEDHVTLMDFGLTFDPDRTAITVQGAMVGTPRYLAPETVLGLPHTPASDLYAAGLAAHEMLTGKPLVPRGLSLEETLATILERPPPPVGGPAGLEALVLALLSKDPARRPDARQVLAKLARVGRAGEREASRATGPTPPTTSVPGRRPWVRHTAFLLGSVLTLTVISITFLETPSSRVEHLPTRTPALPVPPTLRDERIDLESELARFTALSAHVQKTWRFGGAVVEGLKVIVNPKEVLPLLHESVNDLDGLWGRFHLASTRRDFTGLILIEISNQVLSKVETFLSRQGKVEALRQRVRRLARHLSPANPDVWLRTLEPVLEARIEAILESTPGRDEALARAYLTCFDVTRDTEVGWQSTPRGVSLRTYLLRAARDQFAGARLESEPEPPEQHREIRRRLIEQLPELQQALTVWKTGDVSLIPSVHLHLQAVADHPVTPDPDPAILERADRIRELAAPLARSPQERSGLDTIARRLGTGSARR